MLRLLYLPLCVTLATCAGDDSATTSAATTATTEGATGGPTGGEASMQCRPPCTVVEDCCPDESECPGTFPFNLECVEGACTASCSADAECSVGVCKPSSGIGVCVRVCAADADCSPQGSRCTGVTDDGTAYCLSPCDMGNGCGGFGRCVDDRCVCSSAAECEGPAEGFVCR